MHKPEKCVIYLWSVQLPAGHPSTCPSSCMCPTLIYNATEAFFSFSWRQALVLVDIKNTPVNVPEAQLQNQGSLRYHFSEELFQMPIPLIRIKNADGQVLEAYSSFLFIIYKVNKSSQYYFRHATFQFYVCFFFLQLTETLQQLVKNNEEGDTKESSAKFLQMVQLFRLVTLDQINSLWEQFASEPPYR